MNASRRTPAVRNASTIYLDIMAVEKVRKEARDEGRWDDVDRIQLTLDDLSDELKAYHAARNARLSTVTLTQYGPVIIARRT